MKRTRAKKRYKLNKTKKHKHKFVKLNCSPENKENNYTCYNNADLLKLKSMWNKRHSDMPITTSNPRLIWSGFFCKENSKNYHF